VTIESLGYEGTLGHGLTWADLQFALGNRYYVEDPTALQPTPIVGGLSLGAGRFGGWGIADEMTVAETLTWAGPGAGETRYYLVVARRTWADSETEIVVLNPGWLSAPTTLPAPGTGPTAFNQSPGDVDDQPLFVVPWSFGNSQPSAPLDIRLIGGHESFVSGHALVLSYADWAGCVIRIGDLTYRRVLNVAGALVWDVQQPVGTARTLTVSQGSAVFTPAAGWTLAGNTTALNNAYTYATRDGNLVDINVDVRRTGAAIATDVYGNMADTQVGTVASAFRPIRTIRMEGRYFGGPAVNNRAPAVAKLYLTPTGVVMLEAGEPAVDLSQLTITTAGSLQWHDTYLRHTNG